MIPAIRLSSEFDVSSNRVDFMLHFAAPNKDNPPQCASAQLDTGDGMRYHLGQYCSSTADVWRNIHTVKLGSHIYTEQGPHTATLLWGDMKAETQVEAAGAASSQMELPEVQLFHPRPLKEPAMCVKLKLKIVGLSTNHQLRINNGNSVVHWLHGVAGPAQQQEWVFEYAKSGLYTISADLLDGDGFWLATLAESQIEIEALSEEPIEPSAPPEIDSPEKAFPPEARPKEEAVLGEIDLPLTAQDVRNVRGTPWILFYYVKPKFDWVNTYTTPGGSEIARSVSPGSYFAIRQSKLVGGKYWYETSEHGWVSADAVEVMRLSELRGVELGQEISLNIESVIPAGKTPIKEGIVTIEKLNVRPYPGTREGNAPTDLVYQNSRIAIYAESFTDGATWYQIGIERWVHGDWIDIVGEEQPPERPNGGTSGGGTSTGGTSTGGTSSGNTGIITADILNVRANPGTAAGNPPVDRLPLNSQVTIYEERTVAGDRWYRIGADRWVHSGWVEKQGASTGTSTGTSPSTSTGTVTAERLNVRKSPGISDGNAPVGQLTEGTRVQIYESNTASGATWYRIGNERWIHGDWVALDRSLVPASNSISATRDTVTRDVAAASLPVGWVTSKVLSVRNQPDVGTTSKVVGRIRHNQPLPILETRLVANETWYRIDREAWVNGESVGVAIPKQRPASIGADERWVGVNLSEQTAIAYEGDRPVYALLVATGLPWTPTVQGVFRTWWRLESRKMSGGPVGTPYYYNLEEVPWTCYFSGGYALHGAYWHDAFGKPRSHGCVNMSLYDSWWIFQWSAPDGDKAPAVYVYWK